MAVASEYLRDDYNPAAWCLVHPAGDDFVMQVPPRFKPIFERGYESLSSRVFRNQVANADLCVDVGAHYGYYSLLAANTSPALRLMALEPVEENLSALRSNLSRNGIGSGRATCLRVAASSRGGRMPFCLSEASDNGGVYPHPVAGTRGHIEVDAARLDDLLAGEARTTRMVIKIDTEGHEMDVLQGLVETLRRCEEVTLLVEMNPKLLDIAGSGSRMLMAFLKQEGFLLFALDDIQGRIYPLDQDVQVARMESVFKTSCYNVLCVRHPRPVSVLFFSHTGEMGGAERSLLDLVRGLSSRGFLCSVVVPGQGPLIKALRQAGCGVLAPPETETWEAGWWWAGRKTAPSRTALATTCEGVMASLLPDIRMLSPDVIFSQTIVSPWGALCAEALDLPHALSAREYGERDHHLAFAAGLAPSVAALYDSSEAIFCISQDVRRVLFPEDLSNKCEVVYSHVHIPSQEGGRVEGINGEGKGPRRMVGIFGAVAEEKGQADLVHACLRLLQAGHDVHCVLVGILADLEYADRLKCEIEAAGWSHRFTWTGLLEDPYEVMRAVDVVVSCSRLEALGRTLIEGVLLGKPIVYAASGGPREIFGPGGYGHSYEPGDHGGLAEVLITVLEDAALLRQQTSRAKAYVLQRFSGDSYEGLIGERLRGLATQLRSLPRCLSIHDLLLRAGAGLTSAGCALLRVYFAQGADAFNEGQVLAAGEYPPGPFDITVELPGDGYTHLRFDPVEGCLVVLSWFALEITTSEGRLLSSEEISVDGVAGGAGGRTWMFDTLDPQVPLVLSTRAKRIRIAGEWRKRPVAGLIAPWQRRVAGLEERVRAAEAEQESHLREREDLDRHLVEAEARVADCERRLAVSCQSERELKEALEASQSSYSAQQRELDSILSSRSWRWTRFLRWGWVLGGRS